MQLAEEIIEMVGVNQKLYAKELPVDDPKQRCPDIELAKKNLDGTLNLKRRGLKKQ